MKFAVLAAIFTVLVVVAARKRCFTQDDCEADECCVSPSPFFAFRKGECKPMAGEGETCNLKEIAIFRKYPLHCPCEDGLTCEAEQEKDLGRFGKIRINERCVSEPTSKEPEPQTEGPLETEAPIEETEKPDEE